MQQRQQGKRGMKTAESIEAQTERKKAKQVREAKQLQVGRRPGADGRPAVHHGENLRPYRWKKGQSGNPGGKPKHDVAAEIARAVFENNQEALYKAYGKAALKGNAYAFKELADRAYGKITERIQHTVSQYQEATEQAIHDRIRELENRLALRPPDHAGGTQLLEAGTPTPPVEKAN